MSASSETKGISANMEQVTFIHAFNGFFFFDNGLSCLSWNKINKKVLQTLHKIIHPSQQSEEVKIIYLVMARNFSLVFCVRNDKK